MEYLIPRGAIAYLDTDPIIYLTEGNASFKDSIASLFKATEAADARLIASELALSEALVLPLRRHDAELIGAYARLFETTIDALPVSREVLLLAADLRARTPVLKTPDAIHVATATLANAGFFVTADTGIKMLPATMQRISL